MVVGEQVSIRTMTTLEDFEEIGRLQRQALGFSDDDIYPPKLITVAHENGGSAVGAYNSKGELVGFAFNFPGSRYGLIIEWSYLLRVVPAYRGRGLRKRLKLAQREAVLAKEVETICWGFDPVDVARARLSFHDLGAVCSEYVTDFPDPLNDFRRAAIMDDILVAVWNLNDQRVLSRIDGDPPEPGIPPEVCLIKPDKLGRLPAPGALEAGNGRPMLALPIPADFDRLEANDSESAEAWKVFVRAALKGWLKREYSIEEFAAQHETPGWFWYILRRNQI
jgi:predicted GNAT superfamily acetyltransferase